MGNEFEYKTPSCIKVGSERDVETRFLLECLNARADRGALSVLDIGFAGSGYIEDVKAIDGLEYRGMDANAGRVSGKTLHRSEEGKAAWRKTLKRTSYVVEDVLQGTHRGKYDIVMAISTIEHILALNYGIKHKFDPDLDMKAIEIMKSMATGYLLLTFPCGIEKKYCETKNPILIQNGFSVGRHGLIIYDENRYNRVVGDWIPEREMFCVNTGEGMCEVPRAEAFAYEHKDSFVKAVCGVLMRRPS